MENTTNRTVFISGCGGGYDIFGGLPCYFKIKSTGNNDITLINFSFTQRALLSAHSSELTKFLFRVDPLKNVSWLTDDVYFPEQRLSNELQVPVYAIICDYEETRIGSIVEAYKYLIQDRTIDEFILIDCGSDSLLTGKEKQLGTPVEDMSHIRAVQLLPENQVKSKYLAVIGTDVDIGHDVIESDIDARLMALSPYAIFTWLWQYEHDDDIRQYADIVSRCCPRHTIVHSLVCAAMQGHRGYYLPEHLHARVRKSKVSLSEKTFLSTGYNLHDVMHDNVYLERLTPEMTLTEVQDTIYDRKSNLSSSMKVKETTFSHRSTLPIGSSWLSLIVPCVRSSETNSSPLKKKKTSE